ncbi:uncharacterized protein LOC142176040 [Nicotiana tabacum]|uniref:Uncharacterized protein LOC142176040 n=1 Tax=Nicotiana tabacum TaxID=4097 RepID=A0AC58TPN3_TOBAC
MYHQLREDYPKMPWRKLTFNNYVVPRWGFILNLALQPRLHTKDKVAGCGSMIDQTCELCKEENETMQHLFFECKVTREVWERLLKWQGIQRSLMTWDEEVELASKEMEGKTQKAEVYRMTLASCIYYIWIERNSRIFKAKSQQVDGILRALVQDIFREATGKLR